MKAASNALLWASQNRWLREHLPRMWFVKNAVSKFMPGEDIEAALAEAERFQAGGISSVVTYLGENVSDLAEAESVADHYAGVLDLVAQRGLDTEISIKLTHMGLDLDLAAVHRNVDRLARHAAASGNFVWIDIEYSRYVDQTLDVYRQARTNHPNVGLCLQSYLYRTDADLESLLPLRPAIRLVKGAYKEPKEIAYPTREEVSASFARLAKKLLDHTQDGVRVALATHDVHLIHDVRRDAERNGIGRDAYEVQMLYGIRMPDQYRLAQEGHKFRDLIAYGDAWYPWYMRRLAERPANVLFVMRNVFTRPHHNPTSLPPPGRRN